MVLRKIFAAQLHSWEQRPPAKSYTTMLHSADELRARARECRKRAGSEPDPDRQAELTELATTFDESAAKADQDGSFEDGYEEGWSSIAGTDAQPERPTQPLPSEERTLETGYAYGRSDAKDASEI